MYLYGTALTMSVRQHAQQSSLTLLLRGKTGSGKSDLAFRCLTHQYAELISDDQTLITCPQTLTLAAPPSLEGRLEVRGIGILRFPVAKAPPPLSLVIDLVTLDQIDRLPTMAYTLIVGHKVPCLPFYPFEASAPEKLLAFARATFLQKFPDQKSVFFALTPFD